MKQNIHPGIFVAVILAFVAGTGYFLWNAYRIPPPPDHIGLPPGMQRMEDARKDSFKPKAPAKSDASIDKAKADSVKAAEKADASK